MGLRLLTVGKARQDGLATTGKDYLTRLGHYTRVEETVVREERTTKRLRPEDVIRQEGLRIAVSIRPDSFVISLDRTGKTVDSEGLAKNSGNLRTLPGMQRWSLVARGG